MNRPVTAFLVKLVLTIAAILVIAAFYPLYGTLNLMHAIVLGLIISILGYIADLFTPRAVNNIVATAVDLVMATLIVYFGNWMFWGVYVSWTFSWFCGILIAAIEMFYHLQFVRKSSAN
jgi:hypothetical protein